MNLNKKSLSKHQKRAIILEYIQRVHNEENRLVSKREIRKIFHVELYNYFNNLFDMYQKIDVEVPLCFCPKDYARKKIIEYVRKRVKEGVYPTKKEIEANLKIHILTYYNNINHLYKSAGVEFKSYQKRIRNLSNPFHSPEINDYNSNRILNFIIKNHKKGIHPSIPFIQDKLNLSFYKYFKNIYSAYKKAGVEYDRPCPIILGRKKEMVLTDIAIHLLVEMGYTIKRISIYDKKNFNRGPDIEILDHKGDKILVEIKAFHSKYWITTREIQQLKNYMRRINISKGIFITTSNKVNHNPKNIQIINGYNLIQLLQKTNLDKFIKNIKWVQQEKVNIIKNKKRKEKMRRKIINYVLQNPNTIHFTEVERVLKIDKRTYFKNIHSDKLMKIIKNNSNTDNDQLCRDPQQALLDT